MDDTTTDDLILRTTGWRSVTAIVFCSVVAAIFPVASVASVLSFRASGELDPNQLAGLILIEPVAVLIAARAVLEVRNTSLTLTHSDLILTDWRGRHRSIPRQSISEVWGATLPARVPSSDVPTSPRKVVVVTGAGGQRSILFSSERFPSTELTGLWRRLGRGPTDLGKLSLRELDKRFPGTALESTGQMILRWLRWVLAYLVLVAVMFALAVALMVVIGGVPIQVLWRRA